MSELTPASALSAVNNVFHTIYVLGDAILDALTDADAPRIIQLPLLGQTLYIEVNPLNGYVLLHLEK